MPSHEKPNTFLSEGLGEKVREQRIDLDVSQRQVARTSGVPRSTLVKFEKGEARLTQSQWKSLTWSLGLEDEIPVDDVGYEVGNARLHQERSVADVATAAGISKRMIELIESGKRNPRSPTREALSKTLGFPLRPQSEIKRSS